MKYRISPSPGSPAIKPHRIGLGASVLGSKNVNARVVKPRGIPNLPPVHFFAEAEVPSGREVPLRSEALSNRTGRPIEIREIRLAAWIAPQSTIATYDMGGPLRLRMSMNGKPLTNVFVPFWLLGKTEQQPSQVFVGNSNVDDTTAGASVIYIWRLSKPWYVPPGALIDAQFQNTGALRDPVHAMIGLAGNYLPDLRSTSHIPFAAGFVSRSFGYSDVAFDESSERDLVNPLGKTLTIDRIIARVGTLFKQNTFSTTNYIDYSNAGPFEDVNIRILTSTNLPIIREYSGVRPIFGYERSMDVMHTLEPNDFYRVGVQKLAAVGDPTPVFDTWQAQAFVSILGSREEAI